MACDILLGLGLVLAIGGFGGTLTVRMPHLTLAGGGGLVLIVLSQVLPC
jgi:hypothetical protein